MPNALGLVRALISICCYLTVADLLLGNKVLPIPSRTSNRSTRGSSSSVPEALVGRGKLYEDFSSNISVSERDILEEASVTE
jgi:hypothetical protein